MFTPKPSTSSASSSTSTSNNSGKLENAVSEIFKIFNIEDSAELSRQSAARRLESRIGYQSSKPFPPFYRKLASSNAVFVKKYEALKCKNAYELDHFVRLLTRIQDDKETANHLRSLAQSTSNTSPVVYPTPFAKSKIRLPRRPSPKTPGAASTLKQSHSFYNESPPVQIMQLMASPQSNTSIDSSFNSNFGDLPELIKPSVPSSFSSASKTNNQHKSSQESPPTAKSIPYRSMNFHPLEWSEEEETRFGTLGQKEFGQQEQLLLRDLLFVLVGIEGSYIRLQATDQYGRIQKLIVDQSTDPNLKSSVERILNLSASYAILIKYIESNVYGMVAQALVAEIRRHILQYLGLISLMEEMLMKRNGLFLQKMFYMLLPFFATFGLLSDLTGKLLSGKCVGGAVLTILHEKVRSIQALDNASLELGTALIKTSSVPYFDILKSWIYYGVLDDPRHEFFIEKINKEEAEDEVDLCVEEDEQKICEKYWDRYRINSAKTPIFLKDYEQVIYKTGKYISIINRVQEQYRMSQNPSATNLPEITRSISTLFKSSISTSGKSSQTLSDLLFGSGNNNHNNNNNNHEVRSLVGIESLESDDGGEEVDEMDSGLGTGSSSFRPQPDAIEYSFDRFAYLNPIRCAYEHASGHLLHLLVNDSHLMETFNSVKHYMLLAMSDFIGYFMRRAKENLASPRSSIIKKRLDSIMGMAVETSTASCDKAFLKEDLKVEFVDIDFRDQIDRLMNPLEFSEGRIRRTKLLCYESLVLKFEVPFPLSMIFTPKSILCYQVLFRYVFLCRYAQFRIEETQKSNILNTQYSISTELMAKERWITEQSDQLKAQVNEFKNIYRRAFVLRYKMTTFIRSFHSFYAHEVIDKYFGQFLSAQLGRRSQIGLDSVIECHEKLLNDCFTNCYLTNLAVTEIIIEVFNGCVDFCDRICDTKKFPYPNDLLALKDIVEQANSQFDSLVTRLLQMVYSDSGCEFHMMAPFVARIDFNRFYRNIIEASA